MRYERNYLITADGFETLSNHEIRIAAMTAVRAVMFSQHCLVFALAALVAACRGADTRRRLTNRPRSGIPRSRRMAPARLKAAHDDVARIQRSRRGYRSVPGLNDYRAILHAHAEDSAHTGGTRPEMLADAKKVGVNVILLSNHFRPPTDFITDSWRGLHEGVLFIPGSEDRGFLLLPDAVDRRPDERSHAVVHRNRHAPTGA